MRWRAMTKRDLVMGVVMGAAGALLVWFLAGAISDAAASASSSADPARGLGLVVGLGLLILALSNVAAMRARTRRHDPDDWWT